MPSKLASAQSSRGKCAGTQSTITPIPAACNAFTKSELVVLIRRGDHILGQLDIDSDVRAGFGEREHADVKEVADALAVLL